MEIAFLYFLFSWLKRLWFYSFDSKTYYKNVSLQSQSINTWISDESWPGQLAQLFVCQRVSVFPQQVLQQLEASLKTKAAAHQSNRPLRFRFFVYFQLKVELTSSAGRATYTRLAKRLQIHSR